MTALWSWPELAALFDAELPPNQAVPEITGVSIDTRDLTPGDLFVALKGDGDGHDFLEQAAKAGAAAVMLHTDAKPDLPVLRTKDTLLGLETLAAAAIERNHGKRIAITGSAGKTTLRSWLQTLLGTVASTHASVRSYNNHWGVPLSLARMSRDASFGVFEVGTNHPGEIAPLSQLVRPHVAVLINVLPAHIGNFPGMEALTQEKLSIAAGLEPGGTLVLPQRLKAEAPKVSTITFGPGGDINGTIRPIDGGAVIDASTPSGKLELRIPFAGEARLESVLAALGVITALELEPSDFAGRLCTPHLTGGQGVTHAVNGITLIDDSYNANPASMRLALESLLGAQVTGRRIALIGEMLELGDAAAEAHQEIAGICRKLDQVIFFAEGFAPVMEPRDTHLDSVDQLDMEAFVDSLAPGDAVLVKGSNKVFWTAKFTERLKAACQSRASSPATR